MTFDFYSYRFCLRARAAVEFPAVGPANLLRGAFGSTLRKIACVEDCPALAGRPTRECTVGSSCAYARIFEPVSANGPSGLSDPPRPFVFRVSQLASRSVAAGEDFHVGVNFFDTRRPAPDELVQAFAQIARAGVVSTQCAQHSIGLEPSKNDVNRLRVEFRTPTELKSADKGRSMASTPEFAALFARARDRVSTLRALYGPGPLEIDFQAMGQRARGIKMTKCELRHVKADRRSRRTGQVHGLGGFTGVVEYEGDLTEFLPILEAARWTGVGRHCVWGNGEIFPRVILDA